MLSVKQGCTKYQFFEFLVLLDLGLNPGLPDHWRTLYSLDQFSLHYMVFIIQYGIKIVLLVIVILLLYLILSL